MLFGGCDSPSFIATEVSWAGGNHANSRSGTRLRRENGVRVGFPFPIWLAPPHRVRNGENPL